MKLQKKITIFSISALLALSGCGGGSGSNTTTDDSSDTISESGYSATFKSLSVYDQSEELFGGIIGIVDEVGNGKISDPFGDGIASADTTLVESQFSWNSTKDFYDNIISVQQVWNSGLFNIASGVDESLATTITAQIESALDAIAAISDADGDGELTYSDIEDGTYAFRSMISDVDGRVRIQNALDALSALQTSLQTMKTAVSNASLSDDDKTRAAAIVDSVIISGYNSLTTEAQTLLTTLTTLKENPTAANVTAARAQWRAAREPWERGEGHIFGPVDTLGVDPKVDSWPVDKDQLDGALGGWDPSLSNIDGFPVTMKGFHAIEYLLFGDGTLLESAEDAVARLQSPVGDDDTTEDKIRLRYLEALGSSFVKDITTLSDAW